MPRLSIRRPPDKGKAEREPRTIGCSVPVADLYVVGGRGALAGLDEGLQAHQEDRPLGAAVVHELHRLLPALVLEQDDGVVALLFEIETDLGPDPFGGPV